jgi:hypothetical protein
LDKPRAALNRHVAGSTGTLGFPWQCVLEEEALMTKRKLILGFICCCCLVETGNAGLNDRNKKLLETQSLNAPSSGGVAKNKSSPADVNARPSFGPTHGVFDSPATSRSGAGVVSPRKP